MQSCHFFLVGGRSLDLSGNGSSGSSFLLSGTGTGDATAGDDVETTSDVWSLNGDVQVLSFDPGQPDLPHSGQTSTQME